ncbi:putative pentatricopeptide repeat-containing protein [Zea mays]|uniref:Putative pentatricopeptide repeat-containing protein n=1 Tax=Zea mays TaxID=4577 RepID=A0A317Y9D1_MAIZE|nr:putative pentatricopeptide repeat-containing protein [Zea mays]
MLHGTRRRTAPLAAAFFASKPQPQPPPQLPTPQIVEAAVARCPSDGIALSFFLWCARRPGYFHPPSSFDRLLPAASRLASRLGTANKLIRELQALGVHVKPQTFLLLLRLYWRGGLYPIVLDLFYQMRLWGFQPNAFACNVVLDVQLRTGHLDAARHTLQYYPAPNYLTYAIVLTHLCRAGGWSGARSCFIEMLQLGFVPSAASLTAVFACCSKAGTMSELLQLFSFALVSGCNLTSAMWTCLITRLCREGRLEEACNMLAKMADSGSSPSVVTYTPLVRGLLRAGRHEKASELLGSMMSASCRPDIVLYNVLMDSMVKERRYNEALNIYMHILGSQIKPDAYTLSTLAQVLQFSQNMGLLHSLILSSDISLDLVACNSVLSSLCKSGFPSEAIQFYIDRIDTCTSPDSYTHVGLLDSLCQLGRVNHAIDVYHNIIASAPELNAYVHAAILRGLVRQGQSLAALRILREAVRKNYAVDSVCYTVVLHGLFRVHLVEEAFRLFDQMKNSGLAPNTCTYNVMLRGLCKTRDLHAVKQLLTEMECADAKMDSISFNTVAVLLIKSKRIDSAVALIRDMLNLGMKPSTKTRLLLSQSTVYKSVLVDNATPTVESDGSDSSSDLLVCSAS